MGITDVIRENGERLILWSVIIFFGIIIGLHAIVPVIRWLFGLFGITIPTISFTGVFAWMIILIVFLALFNLVVGSLRNQAWTAVVVGSLVILLAIGVGIYFPKAFPTAFQAAMLETKTAINAFIPLP